eukprot:CAMPEP_0180811480 /NCGR_PEP_ID=MMETSP1038_2-20121128/65456_1 /TAXON_ID=632150 /ORGANISM="Azadinium spinosum, Strain 3D9" /LENGTH=64 /DNA_ID=CAMNT_0022852871 /DNA_START=207 /DNA_END=398 /DNA_ORIENTATION=+
MDLSSLGWMMEIKGLIPCSNNPMYNVCMPMPTAFTQRSGASITFSLKPTAATSPNATMIREGPT